MMLGVPPGMMDKNATEANAVASKAVFSELTLWPDLVSMAETITNAILPAYGENLILAFDDPRKTDRALELQEQAEYARTHTIDEVRAKFYEDDPIGDERGKLLVAEIAPGGIPGVDVPEKPAPIIMPPGAQPPEEGEDTEDGAPETEDETGGKPEDETEDEQPGARRCLTTCTPGAASARRRTSWRHSTAPPSRSTCGTPSRRWLLRTGSGVSSGSGSSPR